MNQARRNDLWNRIADRDGDKCYICGERWYAGMSVSEIFRFAEENNFNFPANEGMDPMPLILESRELAMKKLVIEDVDNQSDHSEANFQRLRLAHQPCNLRKDGIGKWSKSPSFLTSKKMEKFLGIKRMRVRGYERTSLRVESASMARNIIAKPKFREVVVRLLKEAAEGTMERTDLILAASADAGISEATGEKYYRLLAAWGAESAILEEEEIEKEGITITLVKLKEMKS